MSAFLAPIHFSVFNKILNQKKIVEDLILEFNLKKFRYELGERFGEIPEGKLEDVIDHNNIHSWLQNNLEITEKSLSFTVNYLLDKGISIKEIENFFEGKGREVKNLETSQEIFSAFTNYFMDGMPCDRAILPLEFTDDKGSWKIAVDVHKKFWSDDGKIYKRLRDSWLKGLALENSYNLKIKDNVYEVVKCTE